MAEISLEERKKFTRKCIEYFLAKQEEFKLSEDALIIEIYNSAIRDAIDAMDVYIKHNREHTLVFDALKEELKWMPLVAE